MFASAYKGSACSRPKLYCVDCKTSSPPPPFLLSPLIHLEPYNCSALKKRLQLESRRVDFCFVSNGIGSLKSMFHQFVIATVISPRVIS